METLATILSSLGFEHYALIVLGLSIFIDVNPKIKFNPIKAIFNYLGKWFNNSIQKEISGFKEEVNNKFEEIQKEQKTQRETLNKLIDDQENKEISRLRWEIINFETSILNAEKKYSRDQYRHIFDDIDKFKRIAKSEENKYIQPEDLQRIVESENFIKEHYEKNRANNSLMFF